MRFPSQYTLMRFPTRSAEDLCGPPPSPLLPPPQTRPAVVLTKICPHLGSGRAWDRAMPYLRPFSPLLHLRHPSSARLPTPWSSPRRFGLHRSFPASRCFCCCLIRTSLQSVFLCIHPFWHTRAPEMADLTMRTSCPSAVLCDQYSHTSIVYHLAVSPKFQLLFLLRFCFKQCSFLLGFWARSDVEHVHQMKGWWHIHEWVMSQIVMSPVTKI